MVDQRKRDPMAKVHAHVRSNAIAYLALFIALGGTSYAAISIPRNSIGAAQIRNHVITPVKFNSNAIEGSVRAWAIIGASGNVIASGGKPTVTTTASTPGAYGVDWGVSLPQTCATVANVDFRSPGPTETVPLPGGSTENVIAGYVSQVHTQNYSSGSGTHSVTGLDTFNQSGQPTPLAFDVEVIC
jgi:hypothetical protein